MWEFGLYWQVMKVSVQLVKAFSKDKNLGNPAGVVHDANMLNDKQMLTIARTLGFSESSFIQKSDKADYKVRFFAAKQEVDFCGHATVAAFHSLVKQKTIILGNQETVTISQETKAGIFPVTCHKDGKIMMTQSNPAFGNIETNRQFVAKLLSLDEKELGELPLQVVATAVPKLIIPVTSLAVLSKIKPDLEGISEYTLTNEAKGFYIFTSETPSGKADFATRFFNPLIGIDEDPATGVAAGPLGCYADKYIFKGSKKQFVIEQGFDMGMGSTIYVDVESGILVGGYASAFGQTELKV